MRRAASSALPIVILLTIVGALFAPMASAADAAPAVTWSATPADENGPDGRSRVSRDLDPGQE